MTAAPGKGVAGGAIRAPTLPTGSACSALLGLAVRSHASPGQLTHIPHLTWFEERAAPGLLSPPPHSL
jgi:hypothetical protein